ncbi:hypothetical protein GW916_00500 [bacterium]|nr:hypothetical protein [bacterium]
MGYLSSNLIKNGLKFTSSILFMAFAQNGIAAKICQDKLDSNPETTHSLNQRSVASTRSLECVSADGSRSVIVNILEGAKEGDIRINSAPDAPPEQLSISILKEDDQSITYLGEAYLSEPDSGFASQFVSKIKLIKLKRGGSPNAKVEISLATLPDIYEETLNCD